MRVGRILMSVFILVALTLAPAAFAGGEHGGKEHGGSYMSHGYVGDSMVKLGRGLVNIVTTPAEFSCAIYYDFKDNAWTAPVTGTVKGAVLMVRRLVVLVAVGSSGQRQSDECIPEFWNGEYW